MRVGSKNNPKYRVVVVDDRVKRSGRSIETIGSYDPLFNPAKIEIKHDRYQYWLGVGAQPTETVRHLAKKVK
ncbi:MAG: 30S ribosomal protein S16 [Candidatus Woykebacteria bacterium RBG_13_40_7b]|uniref:Small ribosomal subunit protein bS16 n=1 Tax=Candidatus Woykebacteria bacterium RBG_13_40_7b TaxID=1802594 RepID=A0A1G1W7I0_9BACT|nr:MAG: 30S ribosomal protein S16 [Candidatus Woykebacteria bacterium RBG_13_40_7b]